MKRLTLLLCLLAIGVSASAQIIRQSTITTERSRTNTLLEKGYRGFASLTPGFMMSGNNDFMIGLSTTHGYQFNRWVYAGAGVEAFRSKKRYGVSFYADARAYFRRRSVKPYIDLRIGYTIACSKWVENEDWSYRYSTYLDKDSYVFHNYTQIGYYKKESSISGLYISPSIGVEIGRFDLAVGVTNYHINTDYISTTTYTPIAPPECYDYYDSKSKKKSIWTLFLRLGTNF